jgi:hypothetical protein
MNDFVAEIRKWFDAIAVARLDGFQIYEGDDKCFVLWLGAATRVVALWCSAGSMPAWNCLRRNKLLRVRLSSEVISSARQLCVLHEIKI